MSAVLMWVRTSLRMRWRAWTALAIAFGMMGGAATAASAGARRTDSAYPRFLERNEAYHVITGGLGEGSPEELRGKQEAISKLPQVRLFALSQFVSESFVLPSGVVVSFPEAFVTGDASGAELRTVNRARVLRGRMFDPDAADEAVADFFTADRLGIRVGDRIEIPLFDPTTEEFTLQRSVTIVGVIVAPGVLPSVGQSPPTGITVTPAFLRANADNVPPNEDAPSVRLHDESQLADFIAGARKIAPTVDIPITLPRHIAGVRKTSRFEVGALWILAGLLGLTTIVIVGQALGRQIALDAGEHPSLRALGMGRAQLVAADLVRALGVGVVGSVIAVPVAYAASALTPRGLARLVEPDPGFHADWTVMAIGAAGTAVAALATAVIPSIRASNPHRAEHMRASRVASSLAAMGAGPSVVAGTRFAFEPGRGTRAVPVRATILGVAVALAAITAAGTFTDSLDALIDRPELYGFSWDVFAGSSDLDADAKLLAADPDVEATTLGGYANIEIGGQQLIPLVYVPGTIEPTMLEGRAPRQADEIALGGGLLRALKLEIGDTVDVKPAESDVGDPKPYRIVGRTIVPPVFFQQVEPGQSSAMTLEGAARLNPDEFRDQEGIPHLIRYKRGVDVRKKVVELRKELPDLFVGQIREPGAELAALSRSSGLPVLLTNVLVVAAIGTLAHTLGSAIRKRRYDLAVLKTLGFVNRQLRATIAWSSTALVLVGVLIGVPAGIIAGRWAWVWFAGTLGVVPEPVSPLLIGLVLVPLATLVLANLIATFPARAAARTRAAVVLRAE